MPGPIDHQIQQSLFEGLFVHAFQPSAALKAELLRIGYDMDRPLPWYPAKVWIAAIDATARLHFPGKSREDAERAIGRLSVEGFIHTLVGRVVKAAMPMLGPDRTIQRIALSFKSVQNHVNIAVEPLGPAHYVVRVREYPYPHHVVAGVIEGGLALTGARARTEVQAPTPDGCDVDVRWE